MPINPTQQAIVDAHLSGTCPSEDRRSCRCTHAYLAAADQPDPTDVPDFDRPTDLDWSDVEADAAADPTLPTHNPTVWVTVVHPDANHPDLRVLDSLCECGDDQCSFSVTIDERDVRWNHR